MIKKQLRDAGKGISLTQFWSKEIKGGLTTRKTAQKGYLEMITYNFITIITPFVCSTTIMMKQII